MIRLLTGLFALIILAAPQAAAQSSLRVTGEPVALTRTDDGPFSTPRWSPDGSRIALTRPGYGGLWVADADGSGLRQVSEETGVGFGFSWSADGSAIVARAARDEDRRRTHAVVVYDLRDDAVRELTDFQARMPSLPAWAPGTADVVVATERGMDRLDAGLPPSARKAGRADAMVLLRDGRLVRADAGTGSATDMGLFPGETVLNLATAASGERVVFEVLGGDAYTMDVATGTPVSIGRGFRPRFSPDGEWVVMMVTEDDGYVFTASDLVAVRSDGSETVRLTDTTDRLEINPDWSPNGDRIVFDDLQDGVIYVLPVAE